MIGIRLDFYQKFGWFCKILFIGVTADPERNALCCKRGPA